MLSCCNYLVMLHRFIRSATLLKQYRALFSEITPKQSSPLARRDRLQFGKSRLVDFGELPHGEIPDALQTIRPSTFNKFSNQVRVTSEQWVAGQTRYHVNHIVSLSLSRQDQDRKICPTAQLLTSQHMELAVELENILRTKSRRLLKALVEN